MVSRQLNSRGFIETTTVYHEIKTCKAIIPVELWNKHNNGNKVSESHKHYKCERCGTPRYLLSKDGNVNLCMMKKGVNICICDNCLDQIDDNLKIK